MMEKAVYRTGRQVIGMYVRLMMRMDIVRHAPLPKGPKIIAANHPSSPDPAWLMLLEPDYMSMLVTEMIFEMPWLGKYMHGAGHIPVYKGRGREAFDEALRRLNAGETIGIYPEGDLSPEPDQVGDARTGTARLALMTGVPVIPVGIHIDKSRILHEKKTVKQFTADARWYMKGPYAMTVGQTMNFAGSVEDRENVQHISKQIMTQIASLARESAYRMASQPAGLPRTMRWTGLSDA